MPYHYTDSGLDNVVLENGYRDHDTPYGKGVSIEDSAGLHKAIGRRLVERSAQLKGAELRFLRIEMERTQRDLAETIGTTEQTLRLWEKQSHKPIPGSSDRLMRALFYEFLGDDYRISDLLDRCSSFEQRGDPSFRFRRVKGAWTLQNPRPATAPLSEPAVVV